ncbi:MAG: hypothetical protein CNF01_00975 [Halieaceae bacterium MED-G27]|nr:MAG: hypothetical protein CNF01_00975 [Halieaceae bacterium MED-G27]|tara:strand:+ start:27053 stop:28597 length:1545 start_codon:yes stop_codon:yes gene_type:complete
MNDKKTSTLPVTAFDPVSAEAEVGGMPAESDKTTLLFFAILGVAIVALIGVFFTLPQWVDSAKPAATAAVQTPVEASTTRPSPTDIRVNNTQAASERSPFSEAQAARERRAAQEVLQIVLEAQESLQSLGVELWAASQYEAAVEQALTGDVAYRDRDFVSATEIYQSVADQLLAIEQQLPKEISERLKSLVAAIERGDANTATALSAELALMAPDRADIANALARALHVSAINALLAEAEQYTDSADPKAALELLEKAADLDPEHQRVAGLLKNAAQAVNDFEFARAMSRGFDALEQSLFDEAKDAFRRASRLKPGSESPSLALSELETAETISRLNRLKAQGERAEAAEDWQTALTAYQAALTLDASILFASTGIARVEPIAVAEEDLTQIVENGSRLIDPNVLAAAEISLAEARAISDAGPQFAALLKDAEATVALASTPQAVTLISDGLTNVVIMRVSKLPAFTETTVMLRPGQYQAMGSRDGFVDVLVPFKVVAGKSITVDVRCLQAIGV